MPINQHQLNGEKPSSERQPQIVIANDLRSGLTVFLTASGEWSEQVTDALVVVDENSVGEALRIAEIDEATNKVTGAYLADSNEQGAPLELRELLRVGGPSVDYMPNQEQARRALSAQVQQARVQQARVQSTPIQSAQGEN